MLETNIHAIWGRKQTAKGTVAAAPDIAANGQRLRLAAQGDIAAQVGQGSEPFSDLDLFGDSQDFVTQILGQGSPPIHATPDELAWLVWLFNANETVTDITGPPAKKQHLSVPMPSLFYETFYMRVGSESIRRVRHADSVIAALEITCGSGQPIMRVTPTVISLDPDEVVAADPALGMPDDDAFVWTESNGGLLVNGTVVNGPTQYTLTLNRNLEPIFGNSAKAIGLQPGTPTIGVSVAMYLDAAAFALANKLLYDDDTPEAGDKPVAYIGALGAFSVEHLQKGSDGAVNGNKAKFEIPGVQWAAPSAIAVPNPGGGGGTLEISGQMRKVAGQPAWRSTVTCDEAAFTA